VVRANRARGRTSCWPTPTSSSRYRSSRRAPEVREPAHQTPAATGVSEVRVNACEARDPRRQPEPPADHHSKRGRDIEQRHLARELVASRNIGTGGV